MRKSIWILALLLLSISLPALVRSQPQWVTITDNTIVAENNYYKITFNLEVGGRLSSWIVKAIDKDVVSPYLPFNLEIALYSDPNEMYPYAQQFKPWTGKITTVSDDVVVVELWPIYDENVTTHLEGLLINETVIFYKNKPYIDVIFKLTNPTNDTVYLAGKAWNWLDFGFGININSYVEGESTDDFVQIFCVVNATGTYIETGKWHWVGMGPWSHGEGAFFPWAGIINEKLNIIVAARALEPNGVWHINFERDYYGSPAIRAMLRFKSTYIAPGGSVTFAFRLIATTIDDVLGTEEAGLIGFANKYNPGAYEGLKQASETITQLQSQISNLQTQITQLEEQVTSLQDQVNTLQSELSAKTSELETTKSELDKTKSELAQARSMQPAYLVGGLIVGIIIGVIVAKFLFKPKK